MFDWLRIRWIRLTALAVGFGFLLQGSRGAGDWPGWRGPTGLGYTDEKDLPLAWNGKTGEHVVWKTLLHGGAKNNPEYSSPGWSSPIVWGDRVFITTATWPSGLTEKERRGSIAEHHVLCFQASDGKQLWDTVVPAGNILVTNFYHGYSVPTPATDGTLVFALFSSGVLAALDYDGKIVWREELPHLRETDDGICSSPILYEDTLILPGIQDMGLRPGQEDRPGEMGAKDQGAQHPVHAGHRARRQQNAAHSLRRRHPGARSEYRQAVMVVPLPRLPCVPRVRRRSAVRG